MGRKRKWKKWFNAPAKKPTEITKTYTYKGFDGKEKTYTYSYTPSAYYDDDFEWGKYSYSYGKKEKGYSASSFWTSRFDDYSWGSSYTSGPDYAGILRSIQRSANVISNAAEEDKEEMTIDVKWSDGTSLNSCTSHDIFISPFVVNKEHCLKPEWSSNELQDVLIAEALGESAMKKTMSPKMETKYGGGRDPNNPGKSLKSRLWYTTEQLAAEAAVVKDYPGFKSYFAALRDYYTDKKAGKKIQEELDKEECAVTATLSLLWELLQPNEHLNLPKQTKEIIDWAIPTIHHTKTSEERGEATEKIIDKILKTWPLKSQQDRDKLNQLLGQSGNPGEGEEDKKKGKGKASGNSLAKNIGQPGELRSETVDGDAEAKKAAGQETSERGFPGRPPSVEDIFEECTLGKMEHNVQIDAATESSYRRLVQDLTPSINVLKSRLKIRNEEQKLMEHGLRRGRLDEGSLYKLGFYHHGHDDRNLFEEEEIKSPPDVAFVVVLDESGSMSASCEDRTGKYPHVFEQCRNMGIVLAETLKSIKGVHFSMIGHTANGYGQDGIDHRGVIIHNYYTPEYPRLQALAKVKSFSNNMDGFAIAHGCDKILKWHPQAKHKIVIHVSDGQPAGYNYGGASAHRHMRRVSKTAWEHGVKVIGIGVADAFDKATGNAMYGEGNFAVTKDVATGPIIVANLITRIVKQMD